MVLSLLNFFYRNHVQQLGIRPKHCHNCHSARQNSQQSAAPSDAGGPRTMACVKTELCGLEAEGDVVQTNPNQIQKETSESSLQTPFRCGVCGFQCVDRTQLQRHKSLKHTSSKQDPSTTSILNPKDCEKCGTTFSFLADSILHRSTCQGIIKNQCPFCKMTFSDDELPKHLKMHETAALKRQEENERPGVTCKRCYLHFPDKEALYAHIASVHGPDQMHQCKDCGEVFQIKYQLRLHRTEMHKRGRKSHEETGGKKKEEVHSDSGPGVTCRRCYLHFPDKSALYVHIAGVHGTGQMHQCKDCDERFQTKHQLRIHRLEMHKRSHMPCVYDCVRCDLVFLTPSGLEEHELTHEEEKSAYRCKDCDQAYMDKASLIIHRNNVHKENGLNCDFCGGAFFTKKDLDKHKFSHMECDYSCKDCVQVFFSTRTELQNHRAKVHLENSSSCISCGLILETKKVISYSRKLKNQTASTTEAQELGEGTPKDRDDLCSECELKALMTKYPCDKCEKAFQHEEDLEAHKHSEHKSPKFKCEICGRGFPRKTALIAHLKKCSRSAEKHKNLPQNEEKTEERKAERRDFMKTKPTRKQSKFIEKHYKCRTCHSSFEDHDKLRIHQILHYHFIPKRQNDAEEGEVEDGDQDQHDDGDQYQCHLCSGVFFTKRDLNTHLKEHLQVVKEETDTDKSSVDHQSIKVEMEDEKERSRDEGS